MNQPRLIAGADFIVNTNSLTCAPYSVVKVQLHKRIAISQGEQARLPAPVTRRNNECAISINPACLFYLLETVSLRSGGAPWLLHLQTAINPGCDAHLHEWFQPACVCAISDFISSTRADFHPASASANCRSASARAFRIALSSLSNERDRQQFSVGERFGSQAFARSLGFSKIGDVVWRIFVHHPQLSWDSQLSIKY